MISRKKVFGICGSTRARSTNHLILKTIQDLYNDQLEIEIFQGIVDLPHFNPDVNDSKAAAQVLNFRTAIDQADGILICTPEYVFSVPGSLKNALEWTVSTTVFSNKPTAIIVASSAGSIAFESLTLIMQTLGASMTAETQLLMQGVRSHIDKENNSVYPATVTLLQKLMNSLIGIMGVDNPSSFPAH